MNLTKEELRIGNYVSSPRGIERVSAIGTPIDVMFSDNSGYQLKYLSPILLTEELLLRCGLKPNEWFCCDGYCVVEDRDADTHYGWCMKVRNASHTREIEFGYFKYLHQLQNLYFALTSEELTLKD